MWGIPLQTGGGHDHPVAYQVSLSQAARSGKGLVLSAADMGSSQSKENALIVTVSATHKKKVGPLLRANHKHSLLLDTDPPRPSLISQSLTAACLLEIQPVSALFDLWDKLAVHTIDTTDSEDEIVRVDYLDPANLGDEAQVTRYLDFFDDEMVRMLYSYEACARHYLAVDEVVAGLMARDGWAAKQLASAVEMEDKELCTEALAGALSFRRPLPKYDDPAPEDDEVPRTQEDVVRRRNEVIEQTLVCKTPDLHTVDQLVVLNAICVLWSFMPASQFAILWRAQNARLAALDNTTRATTRTSTEPDGDTFDPDTFWRGIIGHVCEKMPTSLPAVRLLRDHPTHGIGLAQTLFSTHA